MKIEADRNLWLFPDMVPKGKALTFEVGPFGTVESKTGKEIPYVTLTGGDESLNLFGEFQLSLWNCIKGKCVEKWGDDSEKWNGKLVEVTVSNAKILLTPVEK